MTRFVVERAGDFSLLNDGRIPKELGRIVGGVVVSMRQGGSIASAVQFKDTDVKKYSLEEDEALKEILGQLRVSISQGSGPKPSEYFVGYLD